MNAPGGEIFLTKTILSSPSFASPVRKKFKLEFIKESRKIDLVLEIIKDEFL